MQYSFFFFLDLIFIHTCIFICHMLYILYVLFVYALIILEEIMYLPLVNLKF